jgi:(p)ppGpp synthase/HD superfamily hydrolase
MKELAFAIPLAVRAHHGQVDLQGEPYIFHPLRVMLAVPLELRPAAVLHDVLEDTQMEAEDLLRRGMTGRTVELVELLTKDPDELYIDYILRVFQDADAVEIKVADIRDNMARLDGLEPEQAASMKERYMRALALLGG